MTDLYAIGAVILGVIALVIRAITKAEERGEDNAIKEGQEDAQERIEAGNKRVSDHRGLSPDERLRRNDSQW